MKGVECRYWFCSDDANTPRWDYSYLEDKGNTRFVFETRTNFAVKLNNPTKKVITIDSEIFPTQLSDERFGGYKLLEKSIGRRFKDYSMSDQEIHDLVGSAVAFADKESEKSRVGHGDDDEEGPLVVVVINVEVCTVQREGETRDVVVERAIRPRNLFPLYLCVWHCFSRPTGILKAEDNLVKAERKAFNKYHLVYLRDELATTRLGDEDESEDCSICLRNPAVGDEVSSLECGHVFHHLCIVRWFLHHNTCPLCRRQAHVFIPKLCS